jgi:hypothetical protein
LLYPEPPELSLKGGRIGGLHRVDKQEFFIASFEGVIAKKGRSEAKGCSIEVRFPKHPLPGQLMKGEEVDKIDIGYGSQSRNVFGILRVQQLTAQLYLSDYKEGKVGQPQARTRCDRVSSDWNEIDVF